MNAECQVDIKTDGIVRSDTTLAVTDATDAILYISADTNFVNYKDVSASPYQKVTEY